MKKIPQLFLLSTLSLGLVSPMLVKAETTVPTVPTETTTTTTTESIPASDSNIIENTTTTTPETTMSTGETADTTDSDNIVTHTENKMNMPSEETTTSENVAAETTENSASSRAMQIAAIQPLTGDGTKNNPYKVFDYSQLTTVATEINNANYYTNTNQGTVYINLMSDITSSGTRVTFSSNKNPILIDGSTNDNDTGNHYIFYTGGTTYAGLFALGTSDMNITFKNLNFGSTTSSASNYYGFCYSTDNKNSISIQDVNYYAETGGQPFYFTGSSSILNFYGNNSFIVSSNGKDSQEFAEFNGTMNFKENTKTSIVHKTGTDLAFLWTYSSIQMNVEQNAQVFIQSGKRDMFYPNRAANLSVSENAKFTYLFDNNLSYIDPKTVFGDPTNYKTITVSGTSNAGSNRFFDAGSTFNISAKKNSNVNFITNNLPFQRGSLAIDAEDTAKINFKNNTDTNSALIDTSTSLDIKNSTLNNTIYNFKKTGLGTAPTTTNEFVLPSKSITSMTTGFTNYNSLVFEPAVKVGGVSSTGTSAANVSQVISNLTGVSSALDSTFSYQAQYYISNSSTILDDATVTSKYTNASATPSNSTTHYDGSVYQALKTLPSTASSTEDQKTAAVLDQLLSGRYTVYGRLQIKDSNGVSYYTPWLNTAATINPYSSFVFPSTINLNNSFTYQRSGGVLGLKFNQTPLYTISNSSNQIMDVRPAIMTPNSGNQVTLVSGSPGTNNDKKLQLKLVSSTTTPIWNLADLTNPTILELQPYWDTTNNKKQFYFDGAYSGPIVTQNKAAVSYNLVFSMQPR